MTTITLAAGQTVTISDDAETIVLGAGDVVTIAGNGDVVEGSGGDTIVDNGAGNVVDAGDGSVLVMNGAGASDSIGANSTGYANAGGDVLTIGTGSFAVLQGGSDTGYAVGTGGFNLAGGNETAHVAAGGYIGVVSGQGNVAYVNSGTVTTLDGVSVTVVGSGDQVNGGAGASYAVLGDNDTVVEGNGSFTALMGSNDRGTANGTGGFNIDGAGDSATVADGSYVGVITGSTGAAIVDNDGLVQTNANVGFTLTGSGDQVIVGGNSTGAVIGSGDTLNEDGAGDAFNVQSTGGAADTVNLNGSGDYVGLLGGSGYVVQGSGGSVGTWDDTAFTVTGDDDSIGVDWAPDGASTAGSSGSVTGTGDVLTENGTGDAFSVTNTGAVTDTVVESGTGDTATVQDQASGAGVVQLQGSNNTAVLLSGGGYRVKGANGAISGADNTNFDATVDNVTVHVGNSANGSVTGTGDTLSEDGANDTFDVQNTGAQGDTVVENGAQDSATASNAGVGPTSIVFASSNGFAGFTGGSGYYVTGSGGTVNALPGTQLNVAGNNDAVSVNGNSGGSVVGTGDQLSIYGPSSTFTVINNSAGSNVVDEDGVGDQVNVQDGVSGATSIVNMNAPLGYAGLLGGTGYVVNGSGGTISTWNNTGFDAAGSGNIINAAPGSTAAVIGGGNIIDAGASTAVIVAGTGGVADEVVASGDQAGDRAADGQAAGITVLDGGAANVVGDNDTVLAGDGASVGAFGNGNAVIVGTGSTAAINGDYNQYAAVSGGTVTFAGVNNSAALNNTTVFSADGNPIALTGASTTAGNVLSPVTQEAVDAQNIDEVYLEVLGRDVDPAGLQAAEAQLVAGQTLDDVRRGLADGAEAQGDFSSTLASVGAAAPGQAELNGFSAVMAAGYDAPITLNAYHGTVLASTSAVDLLTELPVLETLDNGRTLQLTLPDGSNLQFATTADLAGFLYGVAVQKSQADTLVTDTYNQDIAWLDRVDQPMLDVAERWSDVAALDASNGDFTGQKLSNTASELALDIASEPPGDRQTIYRKVQVNGHTDVVTVYPGTNSPMGDATFHDVDPGIGGILEAVGVAILNVAGAAFPGSPFTYAAIAADLAVAGQDFANGQVLNGILSLAAAAGGGAGLAGFNETASVIKLAAAGVGGIYGAVQGAENGDVLGAIAGTLEAAAAVAGGIGLSSSDSQTASIASRVASGLTIASTVTSVSDAFASGNLAGGLISSLGLLLSNIADDYNINQNSVQDAISVANISPVTIGTPAHIAFVGGFFDDTVSTYTSNGLVHTFEQGYAANNSGSDVQYFTWDQGDALKSWINANGGNVTVIGHSYGADTAASVVAAGAHVNQLVTLDPVSYSRPDYSAIAANAGQWTDLNATGGGLTVPNMVAGVGSAWGATPAGYATVFKNVDTDHAGIASKPVFTALGFH